MSLYHKLEHGESGWVGLVDLLASRWANAGHQTRHKSVRRPSARSMTCRISRCHTTVSPTGGSLDDFAHLVPTMVLRMSHRFFSTAGDRLYEMHGLFLT